MQEQQLDKPRLEAVRWMHAEMAPTELLPILKQLAQDLVHGLPPRFEIISGPSGIRAACYFRLLPGSVATLGSIRAVKGSEAEAVHQCTSLYKDLRSEGVKQIQAVVDSSDTMRKRLLSQAGFEILTRVKQLIFPLRNPVETQQRSANHLGSELQLVPASSYSTPQMAALVADTFVETRDCPALNDLRTAKEVLEGFLEGQPLESQKLWFVLRVEEEEAGLLLLTKHRHDLYELCYMGVVPKFRGKRLGRVLVEQAISIICGLKGRYLALGVDAKNIPALRVYQRFGFLEHQTKAVFFQPQDLERD